MKWLKIFVQGKIDQYRDWQDPDRSETPQMPCAEMNIPMPRDLYAKLLIQAEASGAKINGNRASYKGCTFDWNYDAEVEILHITPDHLPFLFDCPEVESHIQTMIDKAKGAI